MSFQISSVTVERGNIKTDICNLDPLKIQVNAAMLKFRCLPCRTPTLYTHAHTYTHTHIRHPGSAPSPAGPPSYPNGIATVEVSQ